MPYTSFYDQQRKNFVDPLTALRSGTTAPATTTASTGSLPGQTSAPDLESITNLVNSLNVQGQQGANAARIPNNPALETQSSVNIGSELQGQLPADVVRNIEQSAAERGVAIGSPGSDNSNSAMLRALGLDTLNLEQLGQQNLTAADARNPVAPLFNPATQLLTPYQSGQLGVENARLGLDWARSLGLSATPQGRNYGLGQQVQFPTTDQSSTGNWWDGLMGGTPSPSPVATGETSDFGTYATNFGFNPSAPYSDLPDLSNPSSFDTFDPTQTFLGDPNSTNYDPFAGYA